MFDFDTTYETHDFTTINEIMPFIEEYLRVFRSNAAYYREKRAKGEEVSACMCKSAPLFGSRFQVKYYDRASENHEGDRIGTAQGIPALKRLLADHLEMTGDDAAFNMFVKSIRPNGARQIVIVLGWWK